jgi:hypothetical protein
MAQPLDGAELLGPSDSGLGYAGIPPIEIHEPPMARHQDYYPWEGFIGLTLLQRQPISRCPFSGG